MASSSVGNIGFEIQLTLVTELNWNCTLSHHKVAFCWWKFPTVRKLTTWHDDVTSSPVQNLGKRRAPNLSGDGCCFQVPPGELGGPTFKYLGQKKKDNSRLFFFCVWLTALVSRTILGTFSPPCWHNFWLNFWSFYHLVWDNWGKKCNFSSRLIFGHNHYGEHITYIK